MHPVNYQKRESRLLVMKIEKVEVIVNSPNRNFVTLRITTDDGITGLGDGTLNGRELSVASYLRDHVSPLLIGRDPHNIEDTWQYLYRGAYWRRGPVTMAAIAAVDVALWDIKAKVAGLPLYQLLGGASRIGVRAYGHASGSGIPELFDSIRAHQALGYQNSNRSARTWFSLRGRIKPDCRWRPV
jgi:mannonate dehydratase